jgi:sodium/proline symporter
MRGINPELLNAFTSVGGQGLSLIAVLSLLGWGLGYFGQPHILARFMAVRSSEEVPHARRIAMVWVAATMVGALFVGFAGIGVVKPALSGADTEKVFIILVEALLHPVPAGICLAAILAAIMSTADSQLLVSSSALAEDIYRPFVHKGASQRELVWVGRAAVVAIAVCAFLLALDPKSKVLELVSYAWAGFGAAFGPTLILALFWRGMSRNGALAGIVVGGCTVIVWKQLSGGLFDLYEIVPGFLLSAAAIALVSWLDGKRVRGRGLNVG